MTALRRELREEIRLVLGEDDARYLFRYSAMAANEPSYTVKAEIFYVRMRHDPTTRSEIEEAVWVDHVSAIALPLAPSARDHTLHLYCAL